MREIKFRAWVKNKRKMVDVSSVEFDRCGFPKAKSNQVLFEVGYRIRNIDYVWEHKSNIEIMQYTGLTDKNGREIYEGDVVDSLDGPGIVIFEELIGSFAIEYSISKIAMPHYLAQSNSELEIIGNIHEDKHLLEGDPNT